MGEFLPSLQTTEEKAKSLLQCRLMMYKHSRPSLYKVHKFVCAIKVIRSSLSCSNELSLISLYDHK